MGYMCHHAILVTSSEIDLLTAAHQQARGLQCRVTQIVDAPMNGYATFVVVPDGSKEGWPESDAGNGQRAAFIKWMNDHGYPDGSNSLTYAEVQYGDDYDDNRVLQTDATFHASVYGS